MVDFCLLRRWTDEESDFIKFHMNAIMDALLATFSETGRAWLWPKKTLTLFLHKKPVFQMLGTPPVPPTPLGVALKRSADVIGAW